MPTPPFPLSAVGQELYDMLEPVVELDGQYGYAAAVLCSAAAKMFDQVGDLLAPTSNGLPGLSKLFNPDLCPAVLLPWLAQFVGVTLPPGLDVARQRLRIKETDGRQRGRPAAIRGAARQHLTGTQTVYLTERVGGSPYEYNVATLQSETPDQAKVLAALMEQKPAGRVMNYTVITGGNYNALNATHAHYNEVNLDFANYTAVLANPSFT